ncbi:PIN/TRAM domain-containing protein [Planctomycetota bacterium]
MVLNVLRGLFIVALTVVGVAVRPLDQFNGGALGFAIACVLVLLEYHFARRLALVFPSIILGILVGFVAAFILVNTLYLIPALAQRLLPEEQSDAMLVTACVCCYVAIASIIRTKEEFQVVIPYVEFSRQQKGPKPIVLDTSVIIDGRIADVCETGVIESPLVVPRFVLEELQNVSDSQDRMKRNRGRRGMDMLRRLRRSKNVDVSIHEASFPEVNEVDGKLIALTSMLGGRLATTDYNLNKIAQIRELPVLNVNDLANALRPVVLPGEHLDLDLIKKGEEEGQAIGYLDDGTMVVVERARSSIGQRVAIEVTSVIQTSAGRMVFGKPNAGQHG